MSEVNIVPLFGRYGLAEGPHWDHVSKKLYYVDIFAQKIYRYDPSINSLTSVFVENGPVGVAVPIDGVPDKLLVGSATDVMLISWDGKKDLAKCATQKLATADSKRTETRFNDGKVDSSGRFWCGTMGFEKDGIFPSNVGSFYCLDKDHKLKKQLSPVTISNGLAWSLNDDTLYYIDSPTYEVVAFDYNSQTGAISNKRTVFNLQKNNVPGLPDGMTIDSCGNLWVALYGGNGVIEINPNTGKLLRHVKINTAKNITSVMFGDDNLDTLYVTSASIGLNENELKEQPHAGYVFAIKGLGVRGLPANSFKLPQK